MSFYKTRIKVFSSCIMIIEIPSVNVFNCNKKKNKDVACGDGLTRYHSVFCRFHGPTENLPAWTTHYLVAEFKD